MQGLKELKGIQEAAAGDEDIHSVVFAILGCIIPAAGGVKHKLTVGYMQVFLSICYVFVSHELPSLVIPVHCPMCFQLTPNM